MAKTYQGSKYKELSWVNGRPVPPVVRRFHTDRVKTQPQHYHTRKNMTPFFLIGAMLVIVALLGYYMVLVPTWTNVTDQWHYGDSHTTQLDANVGHGGTSHFLAEYYDNRIIVIEMLPEATGKYQIYTLSGMIPGKSTPIIVLTTRDQNGDGKPDLIIQIAGTTLAVILYNTGTGFQEREG